jgi:hypothetical protein
MSSNLKRRIPGVVVVTAVVAVSCLQGYWSLTRRRSFSPDARNYVNVADNLLRGRGFVQDTVGLGEIRLVVPLTIPQPFGVHGPVFPLLIAASTWLGLDTKDAALLIPSLASATLLLLVFLFVRRLYDMGVALWVLVLLLLSDPLRQIAASGWAEPLALVWLLLSLLLLTRHTPDVSRGPAPLLTAGALAGLAFATRYPLLVALPIGALLLLRVEDWRGSVRRVALYTLGFGLMAIPVVLRNVVATGHWMGNPRNPSTVSLFENLGQSAKILFGKYAPPTGWSGDVQLQIAVWLVVGLALLARLRRGGGVTRLRELFLAPGRVVLVLWFLGYTAFLIIQRTLVSFDYLNARLLVPAHLFLMCLLAVALDASLRLRPRWIAVFLLAVCVGRGASLARDIIDTAPAARKPDAAASERRRWIKRQTSSADLIIGQRCTDVPFYLGRPCLHFSQAPEMQHVSYDDICRVLAEACPRYRNVYLVLQTDRSGEEEWLTRYGRFVTDIYFGRLDPYPNVSEAARLEDGVAFKLACQPCR